MKKSRTFFAALISITLFLISCDKQEVEKPYQKPPLVNAGSSIDVILPSSASQLTGTATSYNGPIYGYLWSLISGPNVPKIESPSSSTTKISDLIAGIYKFQLMAIDSAGLTGIDSTSITVKTASSTYAELVLQPFNNSYEGLINAFYPTLFQSTGQLLAEAWTSGGNPFTVRSLIKFDYSSLPTGAIIDNATLYLYSDQNPLNGNLVDANFGTNNSFYIQRITSNWTLPTSFTWNNPPSVSATNQVTVPHTNVSIQDINVSLTQLVKDQITNGNNGIQMKLVNETTYNIRQFYSSKYTANSAKRPKLVINYHY